MKRKKTKTVARSKVDRFRQMPDRDQRRLVIKAVVGLGVLGAAAGAISGYDQHKRQLHDLSAVGGGTPVVVQIHDTSCPICRRLKSRAETVLGKHDDVAFRLADILTPEGRAFQESYGVQKTTLLFFDAEGNHVDTVIGLQTIEQIDARIAHNFQPPV